jgi:hypothetical protein
MVWLLDAMTALFESQWDPGLAQKPTCLRCQPQTLKAPHRSDVGETNVAYQTGAAVQAAEKQCHVTAALSSERPVTDYDASLR